MAWWRAWAEHGGGDPHVCMYVHARAPPASSGVTSLAGRGVVAGMVAPPPLCMHVVGCSCLRWTAMAIPSSGLGVRLPRFFVLDSFSRFFFFLASFFFSILFSRFFFLASSGA